MQIIIAKYSGFCFGVERAIDIVVKSNAELKNVSTYGPIIHNPQVVGRLEADGVKVLNDIGDIDSSDNIIIRSHGVEKSQFEAINDRANSVIDATCPFVLKAQDMAAKLSERCDKVIIFGETDHPEVKGIISYIQGEYEVISDISDVDKLDYKKSYGLLAQTTQNKTAFKNLAFKLKEKCDRLETEDTICNATERRQEATLELAKLCTVMIVIGGRNSANTTRLYNLCKEICDRSYHIEQAEELDLSLLQDTDIVGLTAGASTPKEIVTDVCEYINRGKQL